MDWPEDDCYWMSGVGSTHAVSGHQGRFHGEDGIWVGSESMCSSDIGEEDQQDWEERTG